MKAIRFASFGGYRRFCSSWWNDLGQWLFCGWLHDIKTYWHRARHGWAPKDTWNLDGYLSHVLAGSLRHLAANVHGTPFCYPNISPNQTDEHTVEHDERWVTDLNRWADVFEDSQADLFELYPVDDDDKSPDRYLLINKEERRRSDAVTAAIIEMAPWWHALWD